MFCGDVWCRDSNDLKQLNASWRILINFEGYKWLTTRMTDSVKSASFRTWKKITWVKSKKTKYSTTTNTTKKTITLVYNFIDSLEVLVVVLDYILAKWVVLWPLTARRLSSRSRDGPGRRWSLNIVNFLVLYAHTHKLSSSLWVLCCSREWGRYQTAPLWVWVRLSWDSQSHFAS